MDYANVHSAEGVTPFFPRNTRELARALRKHRGGVSVRGAGYSHGGNTLLDGAMQIDTRHLNTIQYNHASKTVTAECGATMHDILVRLAAHGRTLAEMQSYHNFSLGGSIAVNCHGRGTEHGTIGDTVLSMRVVLADGTVRRCGRPDDGNDKQDENAELFRAVVGGYEAVAVIADATLLTVPNSRVKNVSILADTSFVARVVNSWRKKESSKIVALFGATVFPPRFNLAVISVWENTQKQIFLPAPPFPLPCSILPLSLSPMEAEMKAVQPILQRVWYLPFMAAEQMVRRCDTFKAARAMFEPGVFAGGTALRSYAMAEDANKLHGFVRFPTTTVLQEYFVPVERFEAAYADLVLLFARVNLINLGIRYVRGTRCCLLNYAPVDSVALVLYVNVWNTRASLANFTEWTNAALRVTRRHGGRFYLPYLRTYDALVVAEMYEGGIDRLLEAKRKFDPRGKLWNQALNHLVTGTRTRST